MYKKDEKITVKVIIFIALVILCSFLISKRNPNSFKKYEKLNPVTAELIKVEYKSLDSDRIKITKLNFTNISQNDLYEEMGYYSFYTHLNGEIYFAYCRGVQNQIAEITDAFYKINLNGDITVLTVPNEKLTNLNGWFFKDYIKTDEVELYCIFNSIWAMENEEPEQYLVYQRNESGDTLLLKVGEEMYSGAPYLSKFHVLDNDIYLFTIEKFGSSIIIDIMRYKQEKFESVFKKEYAGNSLLKTDFYSNKHLLYEIFLNKETYFCLYDESYKQINTDSNNIVSFFGEKVVYQKNSKFKNDIYYLYDIKQDSDYYFELRGVDEYRNHLAKSLGGKFLLFSWYDRDDLCSDEKDCQKYTEKDWLLEDAGDTINIFDLSSYFGNQAIMDVFPYDEQNFLLVMYNMDAASAQFSSISDVYIVTITD